MQCRLFDHGLKIAPVTIMAALVVWGAGNRAVRAQTPPAPLTVASVCQPGPVEIGLQGTVQKLSADRTYLTLTVTQVRTADAKRTTLSEKRVKQVDVAPGAPIFRVTEAGSAETDAVEPADAGALNSLDPEGGATIVCLGANGGEGTHLLARSSVILQEPAMAAIAAAKAHMKPGENLLPEITDHDGWWVLPIGGKTKADSVVEDDVLKVTITTVDDQDWHVLLAPSKSTTLVPGATYRLSFQARADQKRTFVSQSQVSQGDFHNTGLFHIFAVTPDWLPYQAVFTAHDTAPGHDSCPSFAIGKVTGTLYFKNMILEATSAKIMPGNLIRPVTDPEGWSLLLMQGAEATLVHENDSLRVTVTKGAIKSENAQVVQYGIHLDEGKWYTVRFRARSPIERTIRISSGVSKQPYHDVGLERQVKVGPAEKTYTLTFQAKRPENWLDGLNVAPSFLIGDSAGTLWLSDIAVTPGKAANEQL